MSDAAAIEAIDLTRVYRTGGGLHDVGLKVARGEVLAVVGPSGCGKSTLLHLLGGLDEPDSGRVLVDGVDWRSLGGNARAKFRLSACGYVTQGLSLLPQATAAENVEVPLVLAGVAPAERRRRVDAALDRVGLREEAPKLPDQLSGGQQQRVAIARALIGRPSVILADEPTGSLDSVNAGAITDLLVETAAELSAAVILVTHNPAVARRAGRTLTLRSGRIDTTPDAPGRA